MNKQEAERKALEVRPDHIIVETIEKEKYFIVSTVPKNYTYEESGLYIGGGIRVDKETGRIGLYNPLLGD